MSISLLDAVRIVLPHAGNEKHQDDWRIHGHVIITPEVVFATDRYTSARVELGEGAPPLFEADMLLLPEHAKRALAIGKAGGDALAYIREQAYKATSQARTMEKLFSTSAFERSVAPTYPIRVNWALADRWGKNHFPTTGENGVRWLAHAVVIEAPPAAGKPLRVTVSAFPSLTSLWAQTR